MSEPTARTVQGIFWDAEDAFRRAAVGPVEQRLTAAAQKAGKSIEENLLLGEITKEDIRHEPSGEIKWDLAFLVKVLRAFPYYFFPDASDNENHKYAMHAAFSLQTDRNSFAHFSKQTEKGFDTLIKTFVDMTYILRVLRDYIDDTSEIDASIKKIEDLKNTVHKLAVRQVNGLWVDDTDHQHQHPRADTTKRSPHRNIAAPLLTITVVAVLGASFSVPILNDSKPSQPEERVESQPRVDRTALTTTATPEPPERTGERAGIFVDANHDALRSQLEHLLLDHGVQVTEDRSSALGILRAHHLVLHTPLGVQVELDAQLTDQNTHLITQSLNRRSWQALNSDDDESVRLLILATLDDHDTAFSQLIADAQNLNTRRPLRE